MDLPDRFADIDDLPSLHALKLRPRLSVYPHKIWPADTRHKIPVERRPRQGCAKILVLHRFLCGFADRAEFTRKMTVF